MPPPRYRLVIEGELGPRFASAFDGMTVVADDGETELIGPIIDRAALDGLLARIAGLGLTLRSLNRIEDENAEAHAQSHAHLAGVNDHDPGPNPKGP